MKASVSIDCRLCRSLFHLPSGYVWWMAMEIGCWRRYRWGEWSVQTASNRMCRKQTDDCNPKTCYLEKLINCFKIFKFDCLVQMEPNRFGILEGEYWFNEHRLKKKWFGSDGARQSAPCEAPTKWSIFIHTLVKSSGQCFHVEPQQNSGAGGRLTLWKGKTWQNSIIFSNIPWVGANFGEMCVN